MVKEIESNLQLIEEKIEFIKKKNTCLSTANDIIEEYQKLLLSGEKITLNSSQQIQNEWDLLSWETLEISDRENLSKRFFLLLEKVTDKNLDKKIKGKEKTIKKLESCLEVFPPTETITFKNENDWSDFFNRWKSFEKEWEYLTRGKVPNQDIPTLLKNKKRDLNQFVEKNKKHYKRQPLKQKPKTQDPHHQKFSKLNPKELLEQLQTSLKTKNKHIYKDIVIIRDQWENLLKNPKIETEGVQKTFDNLFKTFFEEQDKFLQEKEWEDFSNERKRKETLEALKLLIHNKSIQGLGGKLKDFQKEWKSLKGGKVQNKLDNDFFQLIQKGANVARIS